MSSCNARAKASSTLPETLHSGLRLLCSTLRHAQAADRRQNAELVASVFAYEPGNPFAGECLIYVVSARPGNHLESVVERELVEATTYATDLAIHVYRPR